MKVFQVPTRPLAVEVFLDDGRHLSGRIFLVEDARVTGDTELLMGALNDGREFIPFDTGDQRGAHNLVLNKDHIIRVRLTRDTGAGRGVAALSDAEEPVAQVPAGDMAILHLSDGSEITGRVAVETPAALSRNVDKLNLALRFLPVVRDDGVDLVQRCHVTTLD